MNKEDKELQKHLIDEMMKVYKTNPDVMIYMEALMKKYEEKEQEIDRLNNVIEIMEKYFELIIDLGYDYDGLNYEQDLKGLIDDILRFAKLGRVYNTTETIFVDRNKKYNILNEELKEEK